MNFYQTILLLIEDKTEESEKVKAYKQALEHYNNRKNIVLFAVKRNLLKILGI